MSNKIIHIFNDDKFIDPAIKLFESVCPGISEYWIITNEEDSFIYVTSKLAKKFNAFNSKDFDNFIAMININDSSKTIIFFHALDKKKQEIAIRLSEKIIKVWFIWGYDLYGNWPLLKNNIYEKETARFIKHDDSRFKDIIKKGLIFNELSSRLFLLLSQKYFFIPNKIRNILNNNYLTQFYLAAQKMDVVVPVVPTEFSLVKKMGLRAVYAPFTYGCLEDILGDKFDLNVLGAKHILVGNSGDPANNHVRVFKKMSGINLGNRKIYVPLSYGGSKEYIDFVIERGRYYLGSNFIPITDFMPLDKYNDILLSCGFIIFNHIRQQGVGNIITLGYMGAKIFLHEKSPVYAYYKSYGFNVNSIIELNQNTLNSNLTLVEYKNNKSLFYSLYSEEAVKEKIKDLFSILAKIEITKNNSTQKSVFE
jgi:dTDP-N-acetylfucosamine:lipid II N-acetylfucosaminyltransferase